jgi:hypothetical protein
MKHGYKHITGFILLLLACSFLNAQVSVRANIDRDNILIGEPVSLTVEAYVPLGSKINWLNPDTIPHFEILSSSPIDTAENIDGKKISQTLTVTSFDSGRWQIPPFELLVDSQPFYTDSLTIDVTYTPFDPKDDYRDIKAIIEVTNPSMKYVPWVLAGLALISLAAIFILVKNRKFMAAPVKKELTPELSPFDEAMKALTELSSKNIEDDGNIKGYYSEMNDILRKYVARKFGVSTFERTNEELIMQLSRQSIPRDSFTGLMQSLRMSDFVKFAKYRPSASDNKENLNTVRSSIEILDKNFASAV